MTSRPAPHSFDPDTFFAGVHWHQRWEVFDGVFLPGRNPVDVLCDYAEVPKDLSGRRVLDIGAWNGGFSFECERRGAAQVVAFSPEDPQTTGFARLKMLLGSKVEYFKGSVYALDPREIGTFDTIIFFGVLYHLRHPLIAIDRIRSVATDEVFIETHVLDEWLVTVCPPELLPEFSKTPLWRFYPGDELFSDPSNWFGPNSQAVIDAFGTAGFTAGQTRSWGDRASFRAKVWGPPSMQGTYEGNYEVIQESVAVSRPDSREA